VIEPGTIETFTLTDGGQAETAVAERVASFVREARKTLDLALYDVRLPDPAGALVARELRAASERGVAIRLVYNVESGRPPALHPPPSTRPEILAELPVEARPVPGVPDLMHHKYAVRDGEAVWTGSTNWTVDSWTRQENVILLVGSAAVAERYTQNFEELWGRGDVEKSGFGEPDPVDVGGRAVRAWFTPGHGPELSQRIADRICAARRRVRIASPVITSAPVLGTLGELVGRGVDVAGVVDEPQSDQVFRQWREDGHSPWKIPLLAAVLSQFPFSGKQSTPWGPATVHDFMHAKVTIVDDVVFAGSFNLSRSGEMNAENVLEIEDAEIAARMAAFVDQVRGRYPMVTVPDEAMATISAGSSARENSRMSSGESRDSPSSRASIQSSSPSQ
jgi:phosphatidylserine/phosphatidylglycerophosphate/cardiolipin synthase-like enzyme